MRNALDVAVSLLASTDRLETAAPARRLKMSDLFESISDCLAQMSSSIRNGEAPGIGRCATLLTYARALAPAVDAELGEAVATTLGERLGAGYDIDRLMAESRETDAAAAARLEEACGKFRVLAHAVDLPDYRRRTTIAVDLGETFGATLVEMAARLGAGPGDLAAAGVLDFLQQQEGFSEAVRYVLKKNKELYRRLD